jgi:hypothetical protein
VVDSHRAEILAHLSAEPVADASVFTIIKPAGNNRDNSIVSSTVRLGPQGGIAVLKRLITYCLALTALTVAPAMAQTKPDPQLGGIQFITQQSPDQWRGSKLVGISVVDPNDERIGAISEVLVDHSGNPQAVVIGVGGFLGIGQKDVAVPFKTLKWVSHEEAAATAASKVPANVPVTTTPPPIGAPGVGMGRPAAPTSKPATDASLGYPDHAVVNMTKDELTKAPDFRYIGASSAMNVPPTRQ